MKGLRFDRRSLNAERDAREAERDRLVQFNPSDAPGLDAAALEAETGLCVEPTDYGL